MPTGRLSLAHHNPIQSVCWHWPRNLGAVSWHWSSRLSGERAGAPPPVMNGAPLLWPLACGQWLRSRITLRRLTNQASEWGTKALEQGAPLATTSTWREVPAASPRITPNNPATKGLEPSISSISNPWHWRLHFNLRLARIDWRSLKLGNSFQPPFQDFSEVLFVYNSCHSELWMFEW